MSSGAPELVCDLAEKLKGQVRVAPKEVSQGADTNAVQRQGGNRLGAMYVVTALRESEHVLSKEKRQHPPFSTGKVPKQLDDAAGDDEYGLGVRAFPINQVSTGKLNGRRDARDLRTLA